MLTAFGRGGKAGFNGGGEARSFFWRSVMAVASWAASPITNGQKGLPGFSASQPANQSSQRELGRVGSTAAAVLSDRKDVQCIYTPAITVPSIALEAGCWRAIRQLPSNQMSAIYKIRSRDSRSKSTPRTTTSSSALQRRYRILFSHKPCTYFLLASELVSVNQRVSFLRLLSAGRPCLC